MSISEFTLKEQIHDALFTDIINGIYQPGTLLHEKSLMEKYNVSRAPIREALIQLCSERVLINRPKRGYEITTISNDDIQDILQFRIALECTFLQQNGNRIGSQVIEQLEQHTRYDYTLPNQKYTALEHWKNNIAFHLLLFSAYQNDFSYQQLAQALTIQTRYYAQKRSLQWHSPIFYDADEFHIVIVEYIKQRNYQMATNMLKADIEDRHYSPENIHNYAVENNQ